MLVRSCAVLSGVFGLLVIVGWHARLTGLVQIHPTFAPMQYNAALCFLFSGIGLLLAGLGRKTLSRSFAGIVLITGLLTIFQYATSVDLGIDELLFNHYVFTETSHPGRMSPLTAAMFSLSGLALMLANVTSKKTGFSIAAGLASSLIVSMGTVAVFGYITGLSGAYGWGHFTQMAMHTAAGAIVVGTGLIALVWRREFSITNRAPAWLPHAAGIAALSASLVFWNALKAREELEIERTVTAHAETVKNEIVARLDSRIKALDRLARRWEFSGRPLRDAWEDDALKYIEDFPGYQGIGWVDEETRMQWIVPLPENEAVLGKILSSVDKRRLAFEAALKSGEARFSRPLELTEGGTGVILPIPLYPGGELGGYIVAAISLAPFLDFTLPPEIARGYAVSVSEEGSTFYRRRPITGNLEDAFSVNVPVSLSGANWSVRVAPDPSTLATLRSPYPLALLVLGTLFSILLGLSIHFSRKAVARSLEVDQSNLELKSTLVELEDTHEELAAARDAALESARLKSQFLANMSHEIRTPMNGVIGMAELLSHTDLNREQTDHVHTIRESADLLLAIINDILDSSKIESGKLVFENRGFHIHSLVEGSLDVVAVSARTKGLELAGIVRSEVFPYLKGDPGRVRQVLTNILGNAVKFTEIGEVTLAVSLLSETRDKISLDFEIRDTGIGISRENQLCIFDPFNQADSSNTRKYGGTGLGLTICRQIVEALGGTIRVTSEPGVGSTFGFVLDFEKQSEPSTPPVPGTRLPQDLRFLVIDDNATNRDILQLQLANLGIGSENASGGEQALRIMRRENAGSEPFHFAILDRRMPEMDGLTLASRITDEPLLSSTRLILLSSLGDHIDEASLHDLGIDSHLVKPLKQTQLETVLLSLVTGSDPQSEIHEETESHRPGDGLNPSILVVEDNLVNQKVTLLQLRKLGYSADVANNGAEALEALDARLYDIILMDCQMPVMDGYDATREIRVRHPLEIRIIAMTANAMPGDREKCIAVGMDDYVSKPIQATELARVVSAGKVAMESPVSRPETSPVDLVRYVGLTDGDEGMFRHLAADYLAQAEEILGETGDAVANGDIGSTRRLAHKLAGSSATCGMDPLTATLRLLETVPGNDSFRSAAEALHLKACDQLREIRKYLADNAP